LSSPPLHAHATHPDLPSFPTRRSSDLRPNRNSSDRAFAVLEVRCAIQHEVWRRVPKSCVRDHWSLADSTAGLKVHLVNTVGPRWNAGRSVGIYNLHRARVPSPLRNVNRVGVLAQLPPDLLGHQLVQR